MIDEWPVGFDEWPVSKKCACLSTNLRMFQNIIHRIQSLVLILHNFNSGWTFRIFSTGNTYTRNLKILFY